MKVQQKTVSILKYLLKIGDWSMIEKRYFLKYSEYDCANGETIQAEPYYVDKKGEFIDTDYFTIDGYATMSDEQVLELLNENEQLKQEYLNLNDENMELQSKLNRFERIMGEFDISSFYELRTILQQGCWV